MTTLNYALPCKGGPFAGCRLYADGERVTLLRYGGHYQGLFEGRFGISEGYWRWVPTAKGK